MENIVALFRPVGRKEMELVKESGWKKFPPRLPEQPFFYPVCNLEYALQISEWNLKDGGYAAILKFSLPAHFLSKFGKEIVGSKIHEEYWIPADQLDELNSAIIGLIDVVMCKEIEKESPC